MPPLTQLENRLWHEYRPAAPRFFQTELDLALLRFTERLEMAPKVRLRSICVAAEPTRCPKTSNGSATKQNHWKYRGAVGERTPDL